MDEFNHDIVELFNNIDYYIENCPKSISLAGEERSDISIMRTARHIISKMRKAPAFIHNEILYYEGDLIRIIDKNKITDGRIIFNPETHLYCIMLSDKSIKSIQSFRGGDTVNYTKMINLDRENIYTDESGKPVFYGEKVINKNIYLFEKDAVGTIDIDADCRVFMKINIKESEILVYLQDKPNGVIKMESDGE